MHSRSFYGLILAFLSLSATLGAQVNDVLPLDPSVRYGHLPNGLTYYIKNNRTPEKRVELRLVVNAGSVEEDDDQQGLAHLIEHLCFRGTKHFPKDALLHYLQSVGADIGPDANAATGPDETTYKLNVPSNTPEIFKNGLLMLRDWAHDVNFDPTDVEKERPVVIEEWRLYQGADLRMTEKAMPIVYKGSQHAQRLPIGKKEIVEHAPLQAIQRFYRDWYRPDNMAVIIVGDVEIDQAETLIRSLFQDIPASPVARPKPDLGVPINQQRVFLALSDVESTRNVARLSFSIPALSLTTVADLRLQLAQALDLQMMNARLAALLEGSSPPFLYSNASFGRSLLRSRSDFTLLALVSDGGAEAGLTALLKENERVLRDGFSQEEFNREKSSLLKSIEEQYAERDHQESESLARTYIAHYLLGEAATSPEKMHQAATEVLAHLTLDDANRAYKNWLKTSGEIVRTDTNEKAGTKLLTDSDLKNIFERVQHEPIENYQEKAAPKTLVAQLPEPGKIVSRNFVAALGITEINFENGVRVILKPSTFKKDEVVFSAYRPGGQSSFPIEYDLASKLAGGYAQEAGWGSLSKSDLQKILAGKSVQFGTAIDPIFDLVKGQTSAADLETAFQLLYLCFGEPRKDENIYKNVLAANNSFETSVVLNPVLSFLSDLQEYRYNHHPRTQRLVQSEKAWQALTLDQVLDAYRHRFGSVHGYTFIFVGSFTVDAIEPLIARYLGSLHGAPVSEISGDVGLRAISGPATKTFLHGSDPKSIVIDTYEREAEWSLHDAHLLWSLGNILQRVLFDKLRVEMSGAYTLSVKSTLEKIPYGHYDLEIGVPCAPENVEKIEKAISEEVDKIVRDGPTVVDINKEIESQKQAIQKQSESNKDWLWQLELIYRYKEGFGRLTTPYAMVGTVTAENLKSAAKKFWRTDQWVTFVLMPQKTP